LNLFARNNTASYARSQQVYYNDTRSAANETLIGTFSEEECRRFVANMHWCHPPQAVKTAKALCPNYDIENVNIVDVMYETSLEVRNILKNLLNTSIYEIYFKLDEAFITCSRGNCDDDLFKVFTDLGICYTYNMLSASMIFDTKTIHAGGVRIVTRFDNESEPLWSPEKGFRSKALNFPERAKKYYEKIIIPTLNATDQENTCSFKSFRIYIHKPNEMVTQFHEFLFIDFQNYIKFHITPHATRTDSALQKFPADFRKCYFEGERKLKFFKIYTKFHCEWECVANATLEKCGCVKFSMPRDKFTKVCNFQELDCIYRMRMKFSCQCFETCADVVYTFKMQKTPFDRNVFLTSNPDGY
jgi:hypothetical protein